MLTTMHESESPFYSNVRAKSWAYDPTARDLRVVPVLYEPTKYGATSSTASSPVSSSASASSSRGAMATTSTPSLTPATQMFHCSEHGCFRKFSRRYTLIEHQKTHTGEKPHICPAPGCRKSFTTSGNLSRHKRLHGFIKPLECPVDGCMSTFPSNNKLEKHMKYHLGSPVHVCRIGTCGKTFSTMGNLNRHVKHQHGAQGEGGANDETAAPPDSSRGSFCTDRSSTSGSYRGSSELHFQSPTATDDLCYANSSAHTPRGKPSLLASSSSSSGHSIPFPRIYPSGVHANGNPERVWSSDTLLDSLSTIFDGDEQYQQQHYHHQEHQQPPMYQPAPLQPPSFPQSPSLLDDMIHFHVTNFQC